MEQQQAQEVQGRTRTRATGLRGVTNLAVLAPVRDGLVKSFEPISYVERLRKVLDALQSARQNLRESELLPSYFVDTIGRLDIIHHFRYALVPPERADAPWRLSLNVTFDGGWEPYMRAIYGDIGPLLDLLFCHNATHPGSRTSSFEQYCDWVRGNEIPAGFFYAEEAVTLQDQRYLAELEKRQREAGATDRELTRLALPSPHGRQEEALARAMADPVRALVLPLRTLKGLYRLSLYFPADPAGPNARDDLSVLRRFTQSVLAEAITVMRALDQLPPESPLARVWLEAKAPFHDELAWLQYQEVAKPPQPQPQVCEPAKLQSHLLGSAAEQVTHGCVVLLRVRKNESDHALATLSGLAAKCGAVASNGKVAYTVAFSYAGLRALGIAQERLDAFPQEFYEGMEARHALLGDLRGNHPDRWTRPLLQGPVPGQRLDLQAVHVLVQMRLEDPGNEQYGLHPALAPLVRELDAAGTGLRVLAVEPLRSYRTGKYVTGHLGVADGLSQPEIPVRPPADPARWPEKANQVNSGELLLGYQNDRGDTPGKLEELLTDGSFLVVRKLRQRMDHLEAALAQVDPRQRDEVVERMVGRRRDGTPLAAPTSSPENTEFDYATQAASDACPFHAHMRRANPRDGRPYTPRILRRGMSYGPLPTPLTGAADRGVMFMAYCASIAEQFETLQRWVSGGNSSGVGSAQADPLLRVPQAGEANTFRFIDSCGQVVRINFGDQPLVQLQWGLYLFTPSLPVLAQLAAYRKPPHAPASAANAKPPAPAAPHEDAELEKMRALLEDHDKSKCVWASIRAGHRDYQDTAYGHLVGTQHEVLGIMRDKGAGYSVEGYGERMAASVGKNILGMDDGELRRGQTVVNEVLRAIPEDKAFQLTLAISEAVLKTFPALPGVPGDIVRKPIDLVNFSDYVLAKLCTVWFGVPDEAGQAMAPGGWLPVNPGTPRCPGNLLSASRYVFTPHPTPTVKEAGETQGQAVLAAVKKWLAGKPEKLPDAIVAIKQNLHPADDETLAVNIAGILLGFPPTVQPNFLRVLEKWLQDGASLWELQQDLFDAWGQGPLSHDRASTALRERLFATMRGDPVPGMLWRRSKRGGKDPVVLGIASALTDEKAPDVLMFGRDSGDDPANTTLHGCPGYRMAMGVLLGMIAGLMKAGTLRPTGSPVLLILTPNT